MTITQKAAASTSGRSEIVSVTAVNVGIVALNVAVGLVVARHFLAEEYGQLSYYLKTFGMINMLASLGLTSQITLGMARARGVVDLARHRFYQTLALRGMTLLAVLLIILTLSGLLHDRVVLIGGVTAALALVYDFGVGALQGLGRVWRAVSLLALQPLLYASMTGLVILTAAPVSTIFWLHSLSFVVPISLAGAWLARQMGRPHRPILDLAALPATVLSAGTMYLLAIAGTFFTSWIVFRLGLVERFADAAAFAIPLNLILMLPAMVQMPISSLFLPRMTSALSAERYDEAHWLFALFFTLISGAAIWVTAVCALYPTVILSLLYGPRYQTSATLLMTLAPTTYLYTLQTLLVYTLVAHGRLREGLTGALLGAGLLAGLALLVLGQPDDLMHLAIGYNLAALAALAWQIRCLVYSRRALLRRAGLQAAIAAGLGLVCRLIVPDRPEAIVWAIAVLGVATLPYTFLLWRSARGSQL